MNLSINMDNFDYNLPDEKIAKYPLHQRDSSKLLIYNNLNISHTTFGNIAEELPKNSLLVFNNTKVIRARLIFFKPSGARIEIFCLEPYSPADYERMFASQESCRWVCMIGNLKKWKEGELSITFDNNGKSVTLSASRKGETGSGHIVEFSWNDKSMAFGSLLEKLGEIPIPPYLNRKSEESDLTCYQTLYSKYEGSVAAPTAGLHFTQEVLDSLSNKNIRREEVTLHVGAGTFLPVKSKNASDHIMHIESFCVNISSLETILDNIGSITAVGTTSVRTLESLSVLGYRTMVNGSADEHTPIGQWEAYSIPENIDVKDIISALIEYMKQHNIEKLYSSTQIMITQGYKFRIINGMITNFHQPKSTLLLLISALIGDRWKDVYDYAMKNDFRFLSYGDSSYLTKL